MADAGLRHLLHPLYRALETRVHPLRYLFVEITQRCNLKCLHCGSDCTSAARPDELSVDQWLALFERLGDSGQADRMVLVITGGEPLCHPQLKRLLRQINSCGLTWGMVTNGYALTAANVQRMLDHGVSSVTVSLDGLQDSHDWLRGVPGSFERAVAGIQRLAAAGLPFFDVVTCVNPRNLEQLPQVARLLLAAGVPAWRLFSIFPKGRARQNPELLLSPEQLSRMLSMISRQRPLLARQGLALSFSCEGYLPPRLDRQVRDEPYFCRAGISIASVLCDGSIAACPNITRALVQGNVRADDLLQVWEQRFEPFRQRGWMQQGPCAGCAQWKRCQGNSLHLWDDEAGCTGACTYELVSGDAAASRRL